jgi:hypothetical protein
VRLLELVAQGGTIEIDAGADIIAGAITPVRDGDVTGLRVAEDSRGLDAAHGRAVLTARADGRAGDQSVDIVAGGLVQLGAVTADDNIAVQAGSGTIAARDGAIDISSAVATNGSLQLTAFNDAPGTIADVRLGTINDGGVARRDAGAEARDSSAGLTATLQTTGTRGDVIVGRTLTAGTRSDATVDSGTLTLSSVDDVRIADQEAVRSRTGDVTVTAANAATGLAVAAGASSDGSDPAFLRGNIGAARDAVVTAGTLVQLGTVTAGRDIRATAGNAPTATVPAKNGAIDIATATATNGSLTLSAFRRRSGREQHRRRRRHPGNRIRRQHRARRKHGSGRGCGRCPDRQPHQRDQSRSRDRRRFARNDHPQRQQCPGRHDQRQRRLHRHPRWRQRGEWHSGPRRRRDRPCRCVQRPSADLRTRCADRRRRPVAGENQSINVAAGGLVQLGAVAADDSITVQAGSDPRTGPDPATAAGRAFAARDGAIDISRAQATNGSLTLSAFNDSTDASRPADVRLATSDTNGVPATDRAPADAGSSAGTTVRLTTAGTRGDVVVGGNLTANGPLGSGSVTLASVDDVLLAAAPYAVRSVRDDITITAADDVDGLPAGGSSSGGAFVNGGELNVVSVESRGDLTIVGRGDVRIGSAVSTGGLIDIDADGSVTGLGSTTSITGAGRLLAGRDVIVTAGPATASGEVALARLSEISAGINAAGDGASATGGDIRVTADVIAVETARARSGASRAGNIELTARRGGLHLGSGRADGRITLTAGPGGGLTAPVLGAVGDPDAATRDVLDTRHGAANLAAATSVTVDAGLAAGAPVGAAQLGRVDAGTSIAVTADRLTIDQAAAGTALTLTAREGPLFLRVGTAGGSATLTKLGGDPAFEGDEVRVRDSLTAAGAVRIVSATDARLGTVRSTGEGIEIRAGANGEGGAVRYGEVTGLEVSTARANRGLNSNYDRGTLTAARTIDVEAGGLVQLGNVRAGQNVDVEAGSAAIASRDGAIDITSAVAEAGSLVLLAFNDSPASGDRSRLAGIRLGTRDEAGVARLDEAAADSSARTTARIETSGSRTGANGENLAGDVVVAQSLLADGDVTLASARDVRLGTAPDGAADAVPEAVRSGASIVINAERDVTGLAALDGDLGEANRAGSGLRAGTVTGMGAINVQGAGNVRLREVISRASDVSVTAGGSVTGLANNDSGDTITGAGRLLASQNVTVNARGTARLSRISAGQNATVDGTTVAIGAANAGGNVDFEASGTGLHAGTTEAGGTTLLAVRTAGTLATPAVGSLGTPGAADVDTLDTGHGRANLTAQAANRTITVAAGTQTPGVDPFGAAQLGTVAAGAGTGAAAGVNQIAVTADRLTVSNAAANNGAIVLTAREGPLFLGSGSAGTTATLTKSGTSGSGPNPTSNELRVRGTLTAGTASGSGASTPVAGNVTINSATDARLGNVVGRNGTVQVTAARDVTGIRLAADASGRGGDFRHGGANLRTGENAANPGGSDVTVMAGELAQLGAVSAGATVNISSNAIELTDALTAPTVNLTNLPERSNPTRLGGNGVENDVRPAPGQAEPGSIPQFVLRTDELNRISANVLNIQSGTQAVTMQDAPLGSNVGRNNLRILTTGRVDVTGTLNTAGSADGRIIQIGGTTGTANPQAPATLASAIVVTAQPSGGGRLLAGNANLDLRAERVVLGQSNLVTAVEGRSGADVSRDLISNPNSILYNVTASGNGTAYTDPTILTANSLTVTYREFAVFQNTAGPLSQPSGATINDLNVMDTLNLGSTGDNAPNGFALFGVINGRSGNSAALLGPEVIRLQNVNRSNTRINGCLVGSGGGGCLITQFGTAPVNQFDENAANVLRTAEEFQDPFDPIVGTNNEALFISGSIDEPIEPEVDCESDPENPQCPAARPTGPAQQDETK